MNFKLINDRIPALYKEAYKKECKFAVATTTNFYIELLLQQLADTANKLIASRQVNYIADLRIILDALVQVSCGSEAFESLFINRLNYLGRFDERFIGFFEESELEQLVDSFVEQTTEQSTSEAAEQNNTKAAEPEPEPVIEESAPETAANLATSEKTKKSLFKKKK